MVRSALAGWDVDAVIDVRAIYQEPHREIPLASLPRLVSSTKGSLGLRDYEKVFSAEQQPELDIFALRGVDRREGCIIAVRPDQYVSGILPLTAHRELSDFFAAFLVARRSEPNSIAL